MASMFRTIFALVAAIAIFGATMPEASALQLSWVTQFGSAGDDDSWDTSAYGSNVYIVGETPLALPGENNAGDVDAFVRKYTSGGTLVWSRQFGLPGFDSATAVWAGSSGVYVAGYTNGTFPGQMYQGGNNDSFLRKYSLSGNLAWTREFGTGSSDVASSVSGDSTGVYVTGVTLGAFPGQTNLGAQDIYVRKYSTAGSAAWTREFGTTDADGVSTVTTAGSAVYVVGSVDAALPGQTPKGGIDAYIRKYGQDGSKLWTRQFGTTSNDGVGGADATSSTIYVGGFTEGTFPGQTNLFAEDGFIAAYSSSGTRTWVRQFGTDANDDVQGVVARASGATAAGQTFGTLPGQPMGRGGDVYLETFDTSGKGVSVYQFGSAGGETPRAASGDASGTYVAGATDGEFTPESNNGGLDVFLSRVA
jgi:hypothetical protein